MAAGHEEPAQVCGGLRFVSSFQDRLWRPGLEPFRGIARFRIVHCVVDAEIAFRRSLRRGAENPVRAAHADPGPSSAEESIRRHRAFDRVSVDASWIEVDTTDGYDPGLDQLVTFVNDLRE